MWHLPTRTDGENSHKKSKSKAGTYEAPLCNYSIDEWLAQQSIWFNSVESLDYSAQMPVIAQINDDLWHTGDENIVRYLIGKQHLDGR